MPLTARKGMVEALVLLALLPIKTDRKKRFAT
jgi:hypothetical protein